MGWQKNSVIIAAIISWTLCITVCSKMCIRDRHDTATPVLQPIHIPVSTPELEEPFEYNSFVAYLNTLTSVSAGNENAVAENQIASKHFHRIHVTNPVTDEIYNLIKADHNVILTGNAGDGKTTIAVDVIQRLTGRETVSYTHLWFWTRQVYLNTSRLR